VGERGKGGKGKRLLANSRRFPAWRNCLTLRKNSDSKHLTVSNLSPCILNSCDVRCLAERFSMFKGPLALFTCFIEKRGQNYGIANNAYGDLLETQLPATGNIDCNRVAKCNVL
jgi:hypothetical protein